jgi:tetratricopeptide (TPR) repeat protein
MQGKGPDIEQVKRAVAREPGSPLFVILAEHHIEEGLPEVALAVCRAGFEANPSFELGVVAYLGVLKQLDDSVGAARVYERALEVQPRSVKIRNAWASILAAAGRERQARQVALESLSLDPQNSEAKTLIDRLRRLTMTGPMPIVPPSALASSAPSLRSTKTGPLPVVSVPPRSAMRPGGAGPLPPIDPRTKTNPLGLGLVPPRSSARAPTPARALPQVGGGPGLPAAAVAPDGRARQEGVSVSSPRTPPVPPPAPPKSTDSAEELDDSDLEEVGEVRSGTQGGEEPEDQARVKPWLIEATRQGPHFDLTPIAPTMAPRDRAGLRGASVAIRPLSQSPASAAPLVPGSLSVASSSTRRADDTEIPLFVASPTTAPRDADRRAAASPAPRPVFPDGEEAPPPIELSAAAGGSALLTGPIAAWKRRRKRQIVVGVVVGLAVASCAVVYAARYLRAARVHGRALQALSLLSSDQLPGYLLAREQLGAMVADHPEDNRLRSALALVDAHLFVRFSADESTGAQARAEIARATAAGSDADDAWVAAALLDLGAGKPKEAREKLRRVENGRRSWHPLFVEARAAIALGKLDEAARTLEQALSSGYTAPALLLEATVLERRMRRLEEAQRHIRHGLEASPGHAGLRIQELLLQLDRGGATVGADAVEKLEIAAGRIQRYRAWVALLKGTLAARAEDLPRAIRAGQEAHRLEPLDGEIATRLAEWLTGPGGDVARAAALFAEHGAAVAPYRPSTKIDQTRALLLLGRPKEACALLGNGPEAIKSEDLRDRARFEALSVRCAHLVGDSARLAALCTRTAVVETPARVVPCVESYLDRADREQATRLAPLAKEAVASRYLQGLLAFHEGDLSKAASLLEGTVGKWPAPWPLGVPLDAAAPLLLLAEAKTQASGPVKALPLLRQAVELDAASARSRVALARGLVAAGERAEAKTTLDALLAGRPTQGSILGAAGQVLLSLGDRVRAKAVLATAAENRVETPALVLLRGKLAEAEGNREEARKLLVGLLEKSPGDPAVIAEIGRLDLTSGLGREARARLAEALKKVDSPDGVFLLARLQGMARDYHPALTSGLRAFQLYQRAGSSARGYEALVEVGRLLAHGDAWARTRAEELFFEATKEKDARGTPFLELGRIYRTRGDHARTVWCFKQAIAREPEMAQAHLELGQALLAKPKWRREARAALERYLALSPDGKDARRVRALLEKRGPR